MQLDQKSQYVMALGAFRQQLLMLCTSAQAMQAAAEALGDQPDDPITEAVVAECEQNLRAVCDQSAGLRQLFHLASNGGRP